MTRKSGTGRKGTAKAQGVSPGSTGQDRDSPGTGDVTQGDALSGMADPEIGADRIRALALEALADVLKDPAAPAAAKAQASRTLLEYLGDIGKNAVPKNQEPGTPVRDLSPEELDQQIEELRNKINGPAPDPF